MSINRISLGPSLKQQRAAMDRVLARYEKAKAKWPWRDFLTDEERAELDAIDAAKKEWERLNKGAQLIRNRALQRAKYAAGAR